MHKILLEYFSTDVSKSKRNIVNKTLSQNNSANVSEYTIPELEEKGYKEPSATKEVKRCFNIFECGRNILYQLDVTHQWSFMATPQDKYYTEMLENLIKVNSLKGGTFSNKRLLQAFIDVI